MIEQKDLLQHCLEQLKAGETPDRVLARHPEHKDELAPLLGLARAIEARGAESMPAAAKARIRYQLYGAARVRRAPFLFSLPTWGLRLAMTVIVVLLLGGGSWVAQAQSRPGGALFSLRMAVDETRASVLSDPKQSIPLRLQIAEDRLADIRELRSQKRLSGPPIFTLVGETEGFLSALEQFPDQADRALLERALSFVREERALLNELTERAPTSRARRDVSALLELSENWEPLLLRILDSR